MRRAAFCLLALATALVQVVLVDRLSLPGGSVPDIALILVVTSGLTQGPLTGMLTGFVAGLGLDLAPPGGPLIGAAALTFCLIGYGCGRLSGRLARWTPGLLAVAVIALGAGETAQAAAVLIAPGSGVTVAEMRNGLPAAVGYDALLCGLVLTVAAMMRTRPRARRAGGPVAGHGWDARAYGASTAERMPSMALAVRMSRRGVPLRMGAMAHEDRELRAARTTLRRKPDRAVRTRFRSARPGGSPFRHARFRSFRRQARIFRRVPRWTGARYAQRGAAYWRAGGLR